MTTPQGMLADELASISGRCSLEADRETIIKAATELRRQAAAPQGREALTVSDDDWQRALGCAYSCIEATSLSLADFDNAMQHAFGLLSLRRLTPAVAPDGAGEALDQIVGHLGAALVQSSSADDQIIMDHVRVAHELAKTIRRRT